MKKALVLSLAAVLGLGFASFAQTLNGTWDTSIIITPATPAISITSTLEVTYSVSGWSFTSTTGIDGAGWQTQTFDVSGSLGAFSIGSTLVFDPSPVPMFTKWVVTGGLSLAGVTFDGTFTLLPGDVSFELEASGSAGSVDVGVDLLLGTVGAGCDFNFNGVTIDVDFPFCCAEVSSTIKFLCSGFDSVVFTVEDIALPGIDWVTLKAVLTFTVNNKVLVLTPAFDFGATACFDIYLATPTSIFGDVAVNGIGIECEIGGVSFTGISWLATNPDLVKPGILKGTPYWEAYQIATTDDGCCGPFNFEITVYFDHGAQLFDVAELDAAFDIQISTQFTFGMSIKYIMATGFANWTLDFTVEW